MLPIALGGVLGEWALARGFPDLFVLASVLAALSLLLALPLRDLPRSRSEAEPGRGFWGSLGQRDLLPLWWIGTIFALALTSVFAFLRRFVDETGVGSVGDFFSAYAAAAILLRLGFGWLPDRVGPKRVLFPSLIALAAGFLALSLAANTRDVVIAGVLCGIGHGYVFPILFALVVSRASDADRGSARRSSRRSSTWASCSAVRSSARSPAASTSAGSSPAAAGIVALGTGVFGLWDRQARLVRAPA